ncbi:MAG: thioredoxin family protein [Myxococcaceae bacterium]|nr:thioredoxin family protein [Myxococcaceae bacterium]
MRARTFVLGFLTIGCASTPAPHGTWSDRTLAASNGVLCNHRVPEAACVFHHPALAADFERSGDWCAEHARPESQCLICHPDLSFDPLPKLPRDADVKWLARAGEGVGPLEALAVPGRVTVVDFYADWCAPCRKVDAFLFTRLSERRDVAVRKLNVVSWDTALAKEHLSDVASLPYLVVFSPAGRRVRAVKGFDLDALEAALLEASR